MSRPAPRRLRQAAMVGVCGFSLVATPIAAGLDHLVNALTRSRRPVPARR